MTDSVRAKVFAFCVIAAALPAGAVVTADAPRAGDDAPKSAPGTPAPKKGDWPTWGGSPDRNFVSDETGIPTKWDLKKGVNLKWKFGLGSQTYGNPVIAGGRIFVGTNNNAKLRPHIEGDKGVIVCLDEKTGRLLWQATHDKLPTGQVNDWPEQGICSSPAVVGERLYYVSNRCELVCADVNGMLDGKNDGPFKDEKYKEREDADFIWVLDMFEELDVFPHNLATCSPLVVGDMVYVATSNGVDEGHLNVPNPEAPDFLAVNAKTGDVVWERNDCGKRTFHGQWSSPAYGVVAGVPQVIYGGGDGWCYAYDAAKGDILWKFNLNPPGAKYILGGRGTANEIISTPVVYDNKVFVAVGQDPEHGDGVGHFFAIDATKRGDITESGRIWHYGDDDFHRTMSTCAIKDGLVYNADLRGLLYCLDVKSGKLHWKHDTYAAIWSSPTVIDRHVYLGTEDGEVLVFQHGREKKLVATMDMGNSVYTTPVAANGVLYITNRNTLFAIAEGATLKEEAEKKAAMR